MINNNFIKVVASSGVRSTSSKLLTTRASCQTIFRTLERQRHSKSTNDEGEDKDDQMFGILKGRVESGDSNGRIDDIRHQNGFKLFAIEEKFTIDEGNLQREMRKLQNVLHPDRFVDKDLKSQQKSDHLSAMVNEFYQILTNPYERGKYLLSLITDKSQSDIEDSLDKLQMDGTFLARMMAIRETIEDPSSHPVELAKLKTELEAELNKLTSELSEDFASKNIENIRKKLGKLKFVANCHKSIDDHIESFDNF